MARRIDLETNSTLSRLLAIVSLTKPRISALVAVLASTAFFFVKPVWDARLFGFAVSVCFLTMGASALNNFQDRKTDACFERTKFRSLPQGRLSERFAVVVWSALIAISVVGLTLFSLSPARAVICAMISVAFYNGVYTPLKRKTVLAIVPGSFVGTLPVLLGWLAADGALWSGLPWVLMIVTAVWQLPHFWLILLSHSSDYSRSNMPNMLRLFSIDQLRRLTMLWAAVFAVLTLFLPLFGLVGETLSMWILGCNAVLIIITFAFSMLIKPEKRNYPALFVHFNLSMVLILFAIVLQAQS